MKKNIILVLILVLQTQLWAQQASNVYNQFFMNPYLYNPAYAGVEGHTVLFLMHKTQWSNVPGAPVESHANFHVPLKGGLSFGAFAFTEKDYVFKTSGGKVTGGYLVAMDRTHFLRFGMSIGAGNTIVDPELAREYQNDDKLNSLSNNSFLMGDLGMTYHFGHFNLGVSLPSLFERPIALSDGLQPVSFKPTDNVLYKVNYRGHINDDIAIEPHVIYRQSKYLPNQWEASTILHIYHLVWAGVTYRQDAGFVGLLGFKIKESLGVGYSYGVGNASFSNQLGGSHEIHIGYHIGAKKKHHGHSSSFIKSHRLNAEQRAKKEERERQRKLQALKDSRANTQPTADEDALTLVSKPVVSEVKEAPKNTWNYEREETLIARVNEFGEVEKGIKFDRITANGSKEVVFSWLPPPPAGATSETYEIANPDEPPRERTTANGSKEVGVKWVRTIDGGKKEVLVVWDPVLTEEQADAIDHSPSKTLGLGAAKIVINTAPVIAPAPVVKEPVVVEAAVEQPKPSEKPKQEEKEPEVVIEEVPTISEEIPKIDKSLGLDQRSYEELAQSDKPLEVRRGGHLLELPAGNYVVAGAFNSFDLAEKFSDKMFNRGFYDTRVGYTSARGLYYVTINESNDLKSANAQKNKVRQLSGLSKVWVLKVSE